MFILIILILLVLSIRAKIHIDRRILKHELKILYEKMEILLLQSSNYIDNDMKSYLLPFKNIAVNPEYLDPKVSAALRRLAEKQDTKSYSVALFQDIENQFPELKKYKDSFNTLCKELFQLNFLKISNIDICVFCSIVYLTEYLTKRGVYVKNIFDTVIGKSFKQNHQRTSKLDLPTYLQIT